MKTAGGLYILHSFIHQAQHNQDQGVTRITLQVRLKMDAEVETELVKCSMKSSSRDGGSETVAVTGGFQVSRKAAGMEQHKVSRDGLLTAGSEFIHPCIHQYIEVDANLLTRSDTLAVNKASS